MTYAVSDGAGATHWYCPDCSDEIEEAALELEDDEGWFLEDLESLDDLEILPEDDPESYYVPDWDEESS